MGEKRGMKALEAWCRRVVEGYRDVNLENMTTSWRDGLAFCALIHHFRPDLIDYDGLSKENILHNNQLAFSVAEKHLGIPALLEAEDMVQYKVPDKLSIMTYVSQYYQHFQGTGQTKMPAKPAKRPLENSSGSSTPSPESPPGKIAAVTVPSSTPQRHDVCQVCQHRVYILERLIIDSKLYHRTCFKCCRCKSVLKPGSYVDGQKAGEYECVSCPDEEEAEKAAIANMAAARIAHQKSPTSPESLPPLRFQRPSKSESVKIISSEIAKARLAFLSHETEDPVKPTTKSSIDGDQTDAKSVEIGHTLNSESSHVVGESDSFTTDNEKKSLEVSNSVEMHADSKQSVSPASSVLHSSDTKGEHSFISVISKEPNTDIGSSTLSADKISMQLESPLSSEADVKLLSTSEINTNEKDCNDVKPLSAASKSEMEVELEDEVRVISSSEGDTSKEKLESKTTSLHMMSHLTPSLEPIKKRPIPSPRTRRKNSLSPVPSGKDKPNDDSEIYLTPLSSPKLRKMQGLSTQSKESTVHDPGNEVQSVALRANQKPLPNARPSRLSSPPLSPSKTGVVVTDMPLIRPQISERMLSPTRQKSDKGDDFKSSPNNNSEKTKELKKVTAPLKKTTEKRKEHEDVLPPKKTVVGRRKSLELSSRVEERQRSGGSAESRVQSCIESFEVQQQPLASRKIDLPSAASSDSSLSRSAQKSTSVKTDVSKAHEVDEMHESTDSSPKKVPPPRPQPPVFSKSASMTLPCRQRAPKLDVVYPEDLNPFNDDDEEDESTSPVQSKVSSPTNKQGKSLNPFEDSDDDEEYSLASDAKPINEVVTSTPIKQNDSNTSQKTLTVIPAPKDLNPFLSDDDEEDEEVCRATIQSSVAPTVNITSSSQLSLNTTSLEKPKPLPRKSLDSRSASVSPAGSMSKQSGRKYASSPTGSLSKSHGAWYSPAESPTDSPAGSLSKATGGRHLSSKDSGLDISPTGSISKSHGHRKKRPAPKPPTTQALFTSFNSSVEADSKHESRSVSSPQSSRRKSARVHKSAPAPPPPPQISVQVDEIDASTNSQELEVNSKALKEIDNMSLKSAGIDDSTTERLDNSISDVSVMKSEKSHDVTPEKTKTTFGYWKKKKPAPPVPLPPKRQTKLFVSMEEITQELAEIEEKHLALERQGVELEKAIREGSTGEEDLNADEDDLVIQLFELVNQKNALFRRQAELVYIKRQQRLEEEHAELEFQIRCLMSKPENLKTEDDKEQEEDLINHLMEVVMQRNQIIESMDNDRLREALEDQSIQEQMAIHQGITGSTRNSVSSQGSSNSLERTTKKDKKKKDKTLKSKNKEKEKSKTMDEDKDLDEVEVAMKSKHKKDKKRRWF